MMRRVALMLEYDGAAFFGWQRQAHGVSVQSVLEAAASRLTGQPIACVAAGRTDSGVHALAQVVHMDLPERFSAVTIQDALNFHLKPHPVAVVAAAFVDADWSARFSAIGRAYRYDIRCRRARLVLDRGRAWLVDHALDAAAMQAAADLFVGRHDFTSFRATSCQAKSPVRTLDRLEVIQDGEWIRIHAAARSFLHHQVRNMVGSLKLVGEGRWRVGQVAEALEARNRAAAGPTAPPDGLYFVSVGYPVNPFAPAAPLTPSPS
jgi:tRNA pseudouridine38-40 synthase